jgi:acetyltransferase-like isoleucine patch superfamily enzyme
MSKSKERKEKPAYDNYGLTQWYWLVRHKENFKLGNNIEIGAFTVIDAYKGVEIEDNVKIGWGAVIMSYSSIDQKEGKVILRKGCKIGANAVIMPGITIGEGAIVGANSFVNRDVPPGKIYVGNPAREIKKKE